MATEIELQKLKEENPEFFAKTPSGIIKFILSEKTSEKIADIAVKNGVDDEEQVEGIAFRIAWVLLDKLPSSNLATTLEFGVKLPPETAKKIADEANQFISSVMVQLKSEKINPSEKELPKKETVVEEKPKRSSSKDTYREPIE